MARINAFEIEGDLFRKVEENYPRFKDFVLEVVTNGFSISICEAITPKQFIVTLRMAVGRGVYGVREILSWNGDSVGKTKLFHQLLNRAMVYRSRVINRLISGGSDLVISYLNSKQYDEYEN